MKRPTAMTHTVPSNSEELDALISAPTEAVIETVRRHSGDYAVLGASGKMGFHLCLMLQRALQALGRTEQVRAVSRFGTPGSRAKFQQAGCEVLVADLSESEQLRKLPETENLFFLAGVKFGTAHDPELLENMNVRMPARVADRFRQSRIVALSTGCVYSFTSPESGGSTEDAPTDPPGDYARSCMGRERAFCKAAEHFGTRSALIRLNYSIDLRYGVLVDIAQKVLAGDPVDVTTGYVNVIWQGDALTCTIQSLAHVSKPPCIVNVTGPGVLSVRELALAFGDRLERDVVFTGKEDSLAWLNNASRAHSLFGAPDVSLEQMLDWITAWLKNGRELLGKPTHFESRDGRY